MSDDKTDTKRRAFLATTAAGFGALAIPNAVAARRERKGTGGKRRGPPEHANPPVDVALQGGKLKPKYGSDGSPGRGRARGRPDHAAAQGSAPDVPDSAKQVPREAVLQSLQELNAAAEAGVLEFREEGGEVKVHVPNAEEAIGGEY